jgi:hypothetical protein
MKGRTFNSLTSRKHEEWSSKVLGMRLNSGIGPDLIDDEKAVEVKFKLIYPNKSTDKCWRVLGHQLDYDKLYSEIYWGFGFYKLDRGVGEIKIKDVSNFEKIVQERELYVVSWDWIKQFTLYHQSGKTEFSEWNHYLAYPTFNRFPKIILSKEVEGGKLFFTDGVNPDRFSFNNTNSVSDDSCPF